MKQKKQLAVLAVLLVILAGVSYYYFHSDSPAVTNEPGSSVKTQVITVNNPQLHKAGVDLVRRAEYKSSGRNIFSRELPPPPPPKTPPAPVVPKPGDPNYVPPTPVIPKVPPLPVKFFGYGTVPNGTARLAFFSDGDDVYIVKEGELLMNRFRILKINNTNLDYEEVSSGLRGITPLEDQGGTPNA